MTALRGLEKRLARFGRFERIVLDNHFDVSPTYPPLHIKPITTAPTDVAEGDFYYNGTNNTLEMYTGAAFETLASIDTTTAQSFAGAITSVGNFAVGADKFNVTAASGNTQIDGTLNADGATVLGSTLAVTGRSTLTGNTIATTAGTGVTTGSGTIYASSARKEGGIYYTSILTDITGLAGSTTLNDIIGVSAAANCHFGQITAAVSGAILAGLITCLETPAGGDPDIDLYSATVATGTENALVTDLTETVLYARAASWAVHDVKAISAMPAANEYLYLTVGAGGAPGTYTAGKFLIELWGT